MTHRPLFQLSTLIILAALIVIFSVTSPMATEIAARPDGLEDKTAPDSDSNKFRKSGKVIVDIQKALMGLGFYLGSINGHLNAETRAAIRIYQKEAGLKINGKVTRQLWDLLLNTQQVRKLLKRLDSARSSGKKSARDALLSHPATRDLVRDENNERADPTRTAKACFQKPTVRCLLTAASEDVKAVFKPELRDWALGEILVAQSRAGLTKAAMKTASRMHDPRLIMVALRNIAKSQAAAGHSAQARDAAGIIPDIDKRAEALAAIAEIQVRRGDFDDASRSAEQLAAILNQLKSETRQIAFNARIAVILAKSGNTKDAARHLAKAEARARTKTSEKDRPMALRYVAAALAETEHPDQALAVLGHIKTPSERTSVLISAADAQARAGDAAAALAIADTIDAVRYRAVVLGRIALSQAIRSDLKASEATLKMALAAVKKITLPYARSFAISRIALSMTKIGALTPPGLNKTPDKTLNISHSLYSRSLYSRAGKIADDINDNQLRAHTLWTISAAQFRGGDPEGSSQTKTRAKKASKAIKSRLTRVWMFSDLAGEHARAQQTETAWEAFQSGIMIAREIDNPWGRSRALAKLAQTLIELVTPGAARKNQP